jgi:uncharacterized protein
MKKLCIRHANCTDGSMAAAVVLTRLGAKGVEFHDGVYGAPPPDVTGRDVIMVDFSYKRDVLLEMAEKANHILILDHHQTAEADLVDLPDNVEAIFDMERSGCRIAWDHFFPEKEVPAAVQLVEDRDLWRFDLEYSRAFHAHLNQIERRIRNYATYLDESWADCEELAQEGLAIMNNTNTQINELIRQSTGRREIAGYDVPVLNCPPMWFSEAGHKLSQGEPFAAMFYSNGKEVLWGLRSAPDGVDVGEVAKLFGGGGHKHAAGFKDLA